MTADKDSVSAGTEAPVKELLSDPSDLAQLSDEALVDLARSGDPRPTDLLMERYKGYVKALSHARFLIGGETDDLIQEGMIGLIKAVRDYDPGKGASFKTFATLCIVRQQTTAIEAAGRLKNNPLNQSVSLADVEWETAYLVMKDPSPEDIVLDRERAEELKSDIRRALSPFEREVLEYYLKDMGYREIAGVLGKPPKTIDNAIQRIRTKVRKLFEE